VSGPGGLPWGGGLARGGEPGGEPPPAARRAAVETPALRLQYSPADPSPRSRSAIMWGRQCDLDARADCPLPIPSRIASTEEFIPPAQTPEQKRYEARLEEISEPAARKQGLSRRDFLRTGSGMAAALVALNDVFGPCYDVSAGEVQDQAAFRERWPKDQFIFDVQTHHVDVARNW